MFFKNKPKNHTLEVVLNAKEKNGCLHYLDLHTFISAKGINKIKTKELDAMVQKYGNEILAMVGFQELYSIVSSNESSEVMKKWTIAIGFMTLGMAICTVIMLFK